MIAMPRAAELGAGADAFGQLLQAAPAAYTADAATVRVARVGRRLATAAAAEYLKLAGDTDWRFVLLRAPAEANAVCFCCARRRRRPRCAVLPGRARRRLLRAAADRGRR